MTCHLLNYRPAYPWAKQSGRLIEGIGPVDAGQDEVSERWGSCES